jgi:DNA polymerase-3 subunit delta
MPGSRIIQELKPVNLLAGSEPLLLRDWLDAARRELREAGFEDVLRLQVEAGFDWNEMLREGDMMSLFSDRKCRILILPGGKPGQQGGKAIQQLCESGDEDCIYILVVPALDRQAKNSAWYKAIAAAGRVFELRSIAVEGLADWLQERALSKGLQIDTQSAQFLAERTEGNLLAADQELEKLKLRFAGRETVDFGSIEDSVAQSARYSHFLLVDACLAGDTPRALRILRSLEAEGYATVQLRWGLQHTLQQLDQLLLARRRGGLDDRDWRQMGVWRNKQRLYQAALARLDPARVERLLQSCATLDRLGKGQQDSGYPGQDWLQLESLVVAFSSQDKGLDERSIA